MRTLALDLEGVVVVLILLGAQVVEAEGTNHFAATATNAPPSALEETNASQWSFSLAAAGYIVPDERDYLQPTFTADRDWLHLEARYNYEALDTASVWVGYNISIGKKLTLDFTPMIGGVFGDLRGVAPGYKATLSWWKLELYTEGEFVFDAAGSSGNFFYSWTELSLAPVDWFRFGLVSQRTKAYQTDLDIQRGFLVGFACKQVNFTTYVFNLGWEKPTFVLSAGVQF